MLSFGKKVIKTIHKIFDWLIDEMQENLLYLMNANWLENSIQTFQKFFFGEKLREKEMLANSSFGGERREVEQIAF